MRQYTPGIMASTRNKPSVSIITVVFNSRDLLEKTLQSIINQDYPRKELVIIDGGSTDGTLDIIKKYEKKIGFWSSEKDKGIYDAMNKGLQAATGDYLIFINSGDLLEENVLSAIFDSPEEPADIYYGETNMMDESGKVLGTRSEVTTRKLPGRMTWKDMKYGMVVSHQSVLVKKEIAPLYNLEFTCSADIDWVIRCLKASRTVVNTKLVISSFLTGGFSGKQRRRCLEERFKVYVSHYGLLETLRVHLYIGIRGLYHKLVKGKNY